MVTFKHKGSFKKTLNFLDKALGRSYKSLLDKYGRRGVQALRNATPQDTGLTTNSWDYEIVETSKTLKLVFTNSNIVDGIPVAILLQHGHATRSGYFIEGVDYMNPALKPIFESLANEAWREITRG